MSVDANFERAVIAELVLRERQVRRRPAQYELVTELAHRSHREHDDNGMPVKLVSSPAGSNPVERTAADAIRRAARERRS
jgi:hypothetical protein